MNEEFTAKKLTRMKIIAVTEAILWIINYSQNILTLLHPVTK